MLTVSDEDLEDLRARLRRTRWAKPWPVGAWDAGVDGDYLRRLVEYWATDYDWRKHEAAINALPWHVAETSLHYLRFDAQRDGAPALLLANGWPSTFLELVGLAERLSADFTVVVPLLPGYATSPQRPALDGPHVHELWHRLMHDELGFARYGAHGSDVGAGEVSRLGQAFPDALIGVHLLSVSEPPDVDQSELTDSERAYLKSRAEWDAAEGGYAHEQRTRPLTLAQGLSDSPSGLLAWIVEKHRAWSDDFASFSDDFLLTQASLYWFTDSISTSFRPYFERGHGLVPRHERVDVPTALARFPADLGGVQPRSWAERSYNLARYRVMPRGGHFAAHEEPELLAEDITEFFRPLT
ncbi:epoxide hydrolase family protein [Cryptosporangium phraense]|uniref:Epoxide hydrolase n=1 Tax=Cryptosporangium phraense TaxID=2593070 RepID=A0A545AKV0_9ACTN|nr:epoxide hydrolase family protein [Cryptosporangium phraense]TQS41365.1 epoxide hydrolase [Cryptosporangium phraense]